ncbi:hypothetical protein [Roseobacter ponti]|uniref:Uncharacterized protein n=1 Tax=Roseobacter ponti TaxID=1891787 RepID=A0A858SZ14_9RHOB|nr:hypothetical protein [Roseobacter ponti]QJF52893.1 hypothetical protein G3256_17795 [Roseobacter ponti]
MGVSSIRAISAPLILGLICFALHTILVLAGLSDLHPWSQVTYLYDAGWSVRNWGFAPEDLPAELQNWDGIRPDAHKARFFLMWPFMALADEAGLQTAELLTFLKPVFAAITIWAVARVVRHKNGAISFLSAGALLPLAGLIAVMDGRLVFALCGYALLISVFFGPGMQVLSASLLSLLAIWLTSVTSGTFWCATLTLLLVSLLGIRQEGSLNERLKGLIPLATVLMVFSGGLLDALKKVTEYYGGVSGLLSGAISHGPAQFLGQHAAVGAVLVIVCVTAAVSALIWLKILRVPRSEPLLLVAAVPLILGVTGLSVLVLAAVPVTMVIAVFVPRLVSGQKPDAHRLP